MQLPNLSCWDIAIVNSVGLLLMPYLKELLTKQESNFFSRLQENNVVKIKNRLITIDKVQSSESKTSGFWDWPTHWD